MGQVYKVKEGKIVAGVCAGLEASGKGNAWLYRIIFIPPACWIGYLFLALTMKSAETINEVKARLAEEVEAKKLLGGIVEKKEIRKSNSIMKAMNCPGCGAPLRVQAVGSQKCTYCGLELHPGHESIS